MAKRQINWAAMRRKSRRIDSARATEAPASETAELPRGQIILNNCRWENCWGGVQVDSSTEVDMRSPVMRGVERPVSNRGGKVRVSNPDISAS